MGLLSSHSRALLAAAGPLVLSILLSHSNTANAQFGGHARWGRSGPSGQSALAREFQSRSATGGGARQTESAGSLSHWLNRLGHGSRPTHTERSARPDQTVSRSGQILTNDEKPYRPRYPRGVHSPTKPRSEKTSTEIGRQEKPRRYPEILNPKPSRTRPPKIETEIVVRPWPNRGNNPILDFDEPVFVPGPIRRPPPMIAQPEVFIPEVVVQPKRNAPPRVRKPVRNIPDETLLAIVEPAKNELPEVTENALPIVEKPIRSTAKPIANTFARELPKNTLTPDPDETGHCTATGCQFSLAAKAGGNAAISP